MAFALMAAALVCAVGIVTYAKATNALQPVSMITTKLGSEYQVWCVLVLSCSGRSPLQISQMRVAFSRENFSCQKSVPRHSWVARFSCLAGRPLIPLACCNSRSLGFAIRVPDDMCAGGLMSRQTCGGSSWAFVLPKFTDVAL
jgi:hypothetical protein